MVLFHGRPGVGKTQCAINIAARYAGGIDKARFELGRSVGIDKVKDLTASACLAPIWGSRNVIIIDEIDKATPDALDYLLGVDTLLGPHALLIATTNERPDDIDTGRDSERTRGRLQSRFNFVHEVDAPNAGEISALLIEAGTPGDLADAIAQNCGGDCRAALNDAEVATIVYNTK